MASSIQGNIRCFATSVQQYAGNIDLLCMSHCAVDNSILIFDFDKLGFDRISRTSGAMYCSNGASTKL